ncbi:MAG: G-D-S-L family lipolytic protein [Flavobacteriaceae bacterium]
MKNLKYIIFSFLLLGLWSCNEVEDVLEDNGVSTPEDLPELTAGSADFSNYVAIGNSLTIGVTDNGVFRATQINSYPNILAGQFASVGGGDFVQAMAADNFGGLSLGPDNGIPITEGGTRIFDPRLVFNGSGPAGLESVIGPVTVGTNLLDNPTGPFNNLGVPGARSFHLRANGYGSLANLALGLANPYAVRLTGSTPNASIMELALAQSPTFVSLWIGANDVLSYATSGGSNGALTPQATFDASMDAIAGDLETINAQGVMANIPYVTDIPFFTTVPYNAVPLDAATAAAVNGGYAAYNGGIQAALAALQGTGLFTAEEAAARTISFSAGQNAVVIEDESLTDLGAINPAFAALPKYRQATEDDLVVLLAASFIGTLADPTNPASVNGVGVPLADNWVLTKTEIDEITDMTDHINSKISTMATQLGYAHFDANDMFQQIFNGDVTYDGFSPNASLVFGGMISLDGVHPTSRGYAVIANEFMKAIDETYGSNFEASGNLVDIGDYPTNYSPLLQ